MILAFILDNQLDIAQISLKWDMNIGKILFTLSYVKYKQINFSLLVNGKSTERKVHFPQYYKNCWESCFNSNLKWRGCFYLESEAYHLEVFNPGSMLPIIPNQSNLTS